MTTLKIAVEATERNGRLRDDDPDARVHAYDTEAGAFPFHEGITVAYTVKPDTDWARPLLRGQRCDLCSAGARETTV
ncbi:hypothetical protein [Streptomyces sp. DSM 118148]|uniref:hypothetical protein n=1 Tax=Streptomyces sp. DSM 118148 TaxID=3448667 RepID=UPI004040115F